MRILILFIRGEVMIADTSYLLIGRLALQAKTTKDTVRHYEEMGLLKSRKRQAGSRLYNEFHPECVERIKIIKDAQAIGFNLEELKSSLNDYYNGSLDIDGQLNLLSNKLIQVKQQQADLLNVIDQLSAYQRNLKQMKSDITRPILKRNSDKLLS